MNKQNKTIVTTAFITTIVLIGGLYVNNPNFLKGEVFGPQEQTDTVGAIEIDLSNLESLGKIIFSNSPTCPEGTISSEGSKFLPLDSQDSGEDTRIYMPAERKSQRISGSHRVGSFTFQETSNGRCELTIEASNNQ